MKTYQTHLFPIASPIFPNNDMPGQQNIPYYNHHPWPNNLMNWPRNNMVPMVPDSFRFTQPFLPDPIMLATMQSLHIGNPIPFGGLSTSGYPDPQGMIQMRPPNLSPFIDIRLKIDLFGSSPSLFFIVIGFIRAL